MNIKRYNNYIKENLENEVTFRKKYSDYIENGDIKILRGDVGLLGKSIKVLVKNELEIPELEDFEKSKFINNYKNDNDYRYYLVDLPMEIGFNDIVTFEEKSLSDLLKKSPKEIKSYLKSKYDDLFGEEYIDKNKIVSLFKEYYSWEYRKLSSKEQDKLYYSKIR